MRNLLTAAAALIVLTTTIAATPALARPHRHQVCHREWRHGHPIRVCHRTR